MLPRAWLALLALVSLLWSRAPAMAEPGVPDAWQPIILPRVGKWKLVDFTLRGEENEFGYAVYQRAPGVQLLLKVRRYAAAAEAKRALERDWREALQPKAGGRKYRLLRKGDKLDAAGRKVGTVAVFASAETSRFGEYASWADGSLFLTATPATSDLTKELELKSEAEAAGYIPEKKRAAKLAGLADEFTRAFQR